MFRHAPFQRCSPGYGCGRRLRFSSRLRRSRTHRKHRRHGRQSSTRRTCPPSGPWRRLGRGGNGRDVAIAYQEPSTAGPHFESLLEDQVSVEDQAAEGMWRQLIDLPGAWPRSRSARRHDLRAMRLSYGSLGMPCFTPGLPSKISSNHGSRAFVAGKRPDVQCFDWPKDSPRPSIRGIKSDARICGRGSGS